MNDFNVNIGVVIHEKSVAIRRLADLSHNCDVILVLFPLLSGPRECNVCGELATHECKECYVHGVDLDQITFCQNCLVKVSLKYI